MTLKKINKQIREKGIKKYKIAEKLNISPVILSYYLNGKRKPKNPAAFANSIERIISA